MYATADEDGDAVSSFKLRRIFKLGWKMEQTLDKELQAYFSHALYVSNDQIHIADQPGASNLVDDPIKIEPDDQLMTIRQFGKATEDMRIGKGPDQETSNSCSDQENHNLVYS